MSYETTARKKALVKKAIENGILNTETQSIGIMDYDGLSETVAALKTAFPAPFVHTFAVKANALIDVLSHLRQNGLGAEVASSGELAAALAAGFSPQQIVFDAPAKTEEDLRTALTHGVAINLDNMQEFERVKALKESLPDNDSLIGFRINPQIGAGKISSTSTATATSKFGYALADAGNETALIDCYLAHPWLRSLHTHSGSQGCDFSLMTQGIARIVQLAQTINERAGFSQITHLDIGGGLPVNFDSEAITPTFTDYANILREAIPALFSGEFVVKTEFGRAIAAKNGVILSRVEYDKNMGGRHIALTHAGAQILTRTVFLPEAWRLRVSAFSASGEYKADDLVETDIGGPCCFAGDLVAKARMLPRLLQNDFIMIHETGGYYFSNHFDYNSLPAIAVYAMQGTDDALTFRLIRAKASLAQVLANMQPPSV